MIALIDPAIILQSAGNIINNFLYNIRIVDILDIAVITFFLYIVLNWLRQNASRRSMLGLSVLVLIYILARNTGMYMTERLIELLFLVILIGIVVVFQTDMRRIIDRLGSWSFLKKSTDTSPLDQLTNTLTEACSKMAEIRRGALIAIKGREKWDRHLHGGIELDGKVTIPLLLSIFNTKAPGHDGAVLLEGQKILKFGVHLPLSTNLYKMDRGGTRHTAALGLSEKCDALILVVSEERGTISIAKDGTITELDSTSDLKRHIEDYWSVHYNQESTTIMQWWKRRSLRTAVASIVLAFTLWVTFFYSDSVTGVRTFSLPIEFRNLQSSHLALQDSMPSNVQVKLSGTEQAFQTFDPSNVVVSFDLKSQKSDDGTFQITKDNINLPNDLHFYEAYPKSIQLHTRKLITTQLPVKVVTKGNLRSGLKLVSIHPMPEEVSVLMDSALARTDSISTDPVDLSQIQKSTRIQKRLHLRPDTLEIPEEESNQIIIEINVQKTGE